mgnify:CR=1 FL=1
MPLGYPLQICIKTTHNMAKASLIALNKKKIQKVQKYAPKRKAFKEARNYPELSKMPRQASPIGIRQRCWRCGRPRAYMRKFGTCRICFRELASQGLIPGVRKSSW